MAEERQRRRATGGKPAAPRRGSTGTSGKGGKAGKGGRGGTSGTRRTAKEPGKEPGDGRRGRGRRFRDDRDDQGGFGPFASGRDAGEARRTPSPSRRAAASPEQPARRPSLRMVRGAPGSPPARDATTKPKAPTGRKAARSPAARTPERRPSRAAATRAAAGRAPRRRRRGSADVKAEILRLGGRRGPRLYDQLTEAADAFAHDRERTAVKLLEPLRDAVPESPSVRELLGLSLYRLGRYRAAAKELEKYGALSGGVDQHPVRMDCARALGRHREVEALWEELAAVSPSAELVTEGRIVRAGDLADQGRLDAAIRLLDRRAGAVKRPREHHLRLWYALADLEERAGNVPRARELFGRVERHDRAFADVAERLLALR
jgi:hypothetical protein